MKYLTFFVLVVLSKPVLAEPLPPMDMKLDPKNIQKIAIHSQVQTLLLFPKPVTLVIGEGITNGKQPGVVQAQIAEDPRVIILKALEPKAEVLLQVIVDQEPYAFKVDFDDQPMSIVRFHGELQLSPTKEISRESLEKKREFPSPARQRQLIGLASNAKILRSQLPNEYKNYQSRDFQQSHQGKLLSTALLKIARFPEEQALVIYGRIKNTGSAPATPQKLYLQVGSQRFYPLPFSQHGNKALAPGEELSFVTVLIGDGQGGSLHLSLDNEYRLVFNPQPKKP